MSETQPPPKRPFQDYMKYSVLGFELLGYIVFFVAAGYYADKWLGTKPFLLLAGSLLGPGLAMYQTVRRISQFK